MTSALAVHQLRKRFGPAEVLGGVDLSIAEGELVAVVGPSGCGKSTLLRILAGLEAPTGGVISLPAMPGGARRVGLVSQDPALFPWRTAAQNVEYGLELRGAPARERRATVEQLLAALGLAACAGRLPHQLSGGMKRRVALARALAVEPEVLLLDEAFGALDDLTRESLQDWLLGIRARRAFTAVFVTHGIAEAVHLADRVVVLTPAPAQVAGVVEVREAHPRLRGGAAASGHERMVRSLLERVVAPRAEGETGGAVPR